MPPHRRPPGLGVARISSSSEEDNQGEADKTEDNEKATIVIL